MAIANNNRFVVKHGLHTQNIDFVSPDTTDIIQATMLDGARLSFEGDNGQLFSITDDMTGTIFAVNDISGVPSIEVDADGTVRIAETFGNVLIGTNVDDGTTKLQIAGDVSISGTLTANGLTAGGDISFADNERLYFGDGNDLEIYHDGSNSFITDAGTGDLRIRATNLVLQNAAGTKNYLIGLDGGATQLYFDNAVKFTTTSTGIDVTGDTSTDTLTTSGNATIGANLTVTGNLTINGTTTAINTTNLNVQDAVITLASGQATPVNDIGLVFQRYSSPTTSNYNPVFIWEESTDRFIFGATTETGADNDISLTAQYMTIEGATGHVGIGTTNPTVPLSVYTTTDSTGILVQDDNSWSTIAVQGGGGTDNRLELSNFGTPASGSIIRTTGTGHLRLFAGNTETIRITGDTQRVGIGTVTPSETLDVYGQARIGTTRSGYIVRARKVGTGYSDGTAVFGAVLDNPAGGGAFYFDGYTGTDRNFWVRHDGQLYAAGNVGIGTTNPITKLDVHVSGANGINLGVDSTNSSISGRLFFTNGTAGKSATIMNQSNHLVFLTSATPNNNSGTPRMSITDSGRVGIGTNNPGYNLSVASSLNVFSAADLTAPKQQGHLLLAEGENGQADVTHWYAESSTLSYGMRWYYDGNLSGTNTLRLYRHSNSTTGAEVIRFNRDNSNVTFTGNIGIGTDNPNFDLDVEGDVFFLGDLQGGGSQSGTVTTRGSRLINTFLGSSPEDSHVFHPYLHNDLAEFRYRGGTVTVAGATMTSTSIDNMFKPNANHSFVATSSIGGSTWTITLTDLPASLSYTNYIGITFGHTIYAPNTVKIEREVSGVWTTVYDSNVKTAYHIANASVAATPITSIRYTLSSNTGSNQIRINSIFAYDYNSDGMDYYFLPRSGGDVYGNVSIDNVLGTNTGLTVKSKQNSFIVLNSDTDNNASGENLIYFQEGGINYWSIQRTSGNSFQFNRNNTSTGAFIDSPLSINSAGDVSLAHDLTLTNGRLVQQFSDTTNLWTTINTGVNAHQPTANELVIKNNGLNTANSMASIFFRAGSTTSNFEINSARIAAVRENGFNTGLAFATRSQSGGHTEKVRITSAGNVGIGITNPSDPLSIVQTNQFGIRLARASHDSMGIALIGSQRLSFINYTKGNREDLVIQKANGNVGIGTDTPGAKLHVENGSTGYSWTPNIRTAAIIEGNNSVGTTLSIIAPSTGYSGIFFGDEALEAMGQIQHHHTDNRLNFYATQHTFQNISGTEVVRITNAGNVGIGTNNPLYKLDVNGEISIRGGESADDARMYFLASDNSIRFTIETDFDGTTTNDLLGFRSTANDNILVLKGNGNVGIGTTAPTERLHVNGNVFVGSTSDITSATKKIRVESNGFAAIEVAGDANNSSGEPGGARILLSQDGGLIRAAIGLVQNAGQDGAGETYTGTTINSAYFGTLTGDSLHLGTSSAVRATITPAGNVGIGVTNPTGRVEIADTGAVNNRLLYLNSSTGLSLGQAGPFYGLYSDIRSNNSATSAYGVYSKGNAPSGSSYGIYAESTQGSSTRDSIGILGNASVSSASTNHRSDRAIGSGPVAGVYASVETTGTSLVAQTTALHAKNSTIYGAESYGAWIETVAGPTSITPLKVVHAGNEILKVASSGNVGIGTTNPVSPLHIVTATSGTEHPEGMITIHNTRSGGESAIRYINSSTTTGSWYAGLNNSSRFQIAFGTSFTDGNTRLAITTGGNVGIGIINPVTAKFEAHTSTANQPIAYFRDNLRTVDLRISALTTSTAIGIFGGAGEDLVLGTNIGTENVRIQEITGNVGIGTTAPSSKLVVKGDAIRHISTFDLNTGIVLSASATDRPHVSFRVSDNSERGKIEINGLNGAAGDRLGLFAFRLGNLNEVVSILGSGNVGIGTTNPAFTSGTGLEIQRSGTATLRLDSLAFATELRGTTTGTQLLQLSAGFLDLGTSGTTRMRITSGGNIGIGTTNPGYKLEVNGSFAATTKSFVIDHPILEGMKLRYGSLEGPENGVYVRGRLKDSNVITLPHYWTGLVHEDSITVNLTAIGKSQNLWVEDIVNNTVIIGGENINCFYTVYAERKDVNKLIVEYKNEN